MRREKTETLLIRREKTSSRLGVSALGVSSKRAGVRGRGLLLLGLKGGVLVVIALISSLALLTCLNALFQLIYSRLVLISL